MKISYITTVDISTNSGVRKKIYGQIEAMRGSGLEVMLIAPKDSYIVVLGKSKDGEEEETVLGKYSGKGLFRFFNLAAVLYKKALIHVVGNDIDAVFIRYSISEVSLIKTLKTLKERSKKIFIEIPSYPYDLEYNNKQWYKKIGLYIDRIYRKKLKKYVDVIFTPSPKQEDIYGIKTVYFENGISTKDVQVRNYIGFKENTLRFIGVANLNAWHGYDRVIKGIAKYYEKENKINFLFNIVGEGVELVNLEKITEELGLQQRIIFHGKKYGRELDEVYDNSDVAVSSVGFFRLDSIPRTSLKTREACLKGVPFISVKGDPVFDNDFKYMYLVEDKDTPIDVEGVYNWFKTLSSDIYLEEMYQFAVKNLSWEETFKQPISVMKKIIESDK